MKAVPFFAPTPEVTAAVLVEVAREREVQRLTWDRLPGEWNAPVGEKLAVLVEEVGEVAKELQAPAPDPARLRAELIQVAATAVQWAETIQG